MKKDEFLNRISQQLGRSTVTTPPARDEVGVPDFFVKQQQRSLEGRVQQFQECLEQLGGEVHVIPNVSAMREALGQLLSALSPRRIGVWLDENLNEWTDSALESYDVVRWGVDPPEEFIHTDIGITGCSFAVAHTGTLVLSSRGGRGRSVHLLPPVHVALVGVSQLKDRLGEVFEEIKGQHESNQVECGGPGVDQPGLDSYIHFVTGPSRSSDIENDQSIGVHGPAAEHVFLIESV